MAEYEAIYLNVPMGERDGPELASRHLTATDREAAESEARGIIPPEAATATLIKLVRLDDDGRVEAILWREINA